MTLRAECPRCSCAPESHDGAWVCPMHGAIAPLWRTDHPGYDDLVAHLELAGSLPSWAPWPLPPGWSLTDFGAVAPGPDRAPGAGALASVVSCGGMTETDGPVSFTVVTEEPGTGLGARVAGVVHDDPGPHTHERAAQARARIGGASVPVWMVPVDDGTDDTVEVPAGDAGAEEPWDRSVLVGEAGGRWVWLVVSPAPAALGLADWGPLEALGERGPELVAVPFGPRAARW